MAVETYEDKHGQNILRLSIPFLALGVSVGHLAGLSNAEVTIPLISGLLAFVGGSSLVYFSKIKVEDRKLYGLILTALCIGTLVGVYSAFAVKAIVPVEVAGKINRTSVLRSDTTLLINPYISQFRADGLQWSSERLEKAMNDLLADYNASR